MANDFEGKKIFISGSTSGIGYQIAKTFSENGCIVGLNGRSHAKLKKAQKSVKNSIPFLFDLTKKKNLENLKSQIKKKFKKLDYLICNIGSSDKKKNHFDIQGSLDRNFFVAVNLIKSLDKLINKKGKIICVSSICGSEYIDGAPFGYSIAKSALNSYVKCISRHYSEKDITVNAVAPGNIFFEGSTWEKKIKKNKFKVKKIIKMNVPLNRFGTTTEISSICKYICSKDGEFINGAIIVADGGQLRRF